MADKADVVLIGVPKRLIVDGLSGPFNLHVLPKNAEAEAIIAKVGANVRAAAVTGAPDVMRTDLIARFPKLEIISSFGVGYDNIDFKYAADNKVVVCNTPEVLNEEVADTALGLLLCTVREFPQASNFLRAGQWMQGQYRLTRDAPRPYGGHCRHGPHRQGDRTPPRGLRRAGGLSQPQSAGRCCL
jgi:lactate dehydrogenase-like 2-hydroxyacid dehydrogenase